MSHAATQSLQSSALQLEVTDSPYSYRVLERSSGDALVEQNRTGFKETCAWASSLSNIKKTANSLSGTLATVGGGKAQITFTFTRPEVLQVSIKAVDAFTDEVYEEFKDRAGEHYYGVWEYPLVGNIDNRRTDYDFLGLRRLPDVNYDSARAPYYMSSKKYAIYTPSTARGHYMFADENRTGFYFVGSGLTYNIIYGPTYADMMQRYTQIAGGSLMPPLWAFDSIWWRDDHHDDLRGATNAQEVVIHDADRLRELKIPASAIWLDRPYGTGERGWGNMDFDNSFPSPKKMISDLHDRGMYLIVWVANRLTNSAYEEGLKKGYMFDGPFSAADISRPEVYNWLKAKFDTLVNFGIRGYKIDRGEEGEMPRSLENEFAILLPKLAAEGMKRAYGDEFFNFSRNANDTARKYTAIWNGDTQPTFGGLAVSVKNAQRSGFINFPMWGSDTGGYLGNPDKELFARWLEFSAFSPIMEVLNGPKRTIWLDYDNELVQIAQRYTMDHHDMIPYTRSEMYHATQTGMPIVRSLVFQYPDDQKVSDMWDEYMFGDSLLVAPVVNAGETSRSVYLPAGNWLDYNDGKTLYHGGDTITAEAPLNTIPLFVREGAIIPRGDILKSNNNWEANWKANLRIEVYPGASNPSKFDYYTGNATRAITATPRSGGVDVAVEDLGTPGNLEIYWSGANRVTRDGQELRSGSGYTYDASAHKLTVPFTGAAKISVEGGQSVFANPAAASGHIGTRAAAGSK